MANWNEESVKRELPYVPVEFDGRVYDGTLSGRKNRFATLTIKFGGTWHSYEFAWPTIVNILNTKGKAKL